MTLGRIFIGHLITINLHQTTMKKLFAALLATTCSLHAMPAVAEQKLTKGYFTMDAMGCMILKECTEGVVQITAVDDLKTFYPNSNWEPVKVEFARMLNALTLIGVDVYLADQKYFPVGHRGVYHTVSNDFYLNKAFMHRPSVLMSVMRHEGWHAAQDCMAGTIDNSMIAIIKPETEVPSIWRKMVERTYPKSAWPWNMPWPRTERK